MLGNDDIICSGMTEVEKDSHDCVAEMIENLPFYHYIDYKLLLNL